LYNFTVTNSKAHEFRHTEIKDSDHSTKLLSSSLKALL